MSATGVFARLALTLFPMTVFAQNSAPSRIDKTPLDKALTHEWVAATKPEPSVPNPGRPGNAGGIWDKTTGQRFFCNTGYTLPKCLDEISVLQKVISKYPASPLVGWSWILVKSGDWKLLMASLGLHPNTPAFTCLELKETFVEEALVAGTGERTAMLMAEWHLSAAGLLEFAVAHELGHGLCNDLNEETANNVANKLQAGKAFSCSAGGR